MRKAVSPISPEQIIREFPTSGLVEGWYFRQREISNGVWEVEGSDLYGRTVSRCGVMDPETALTECVEWARAVNKEGHA